MCGLVWSLRYNNNNDDNGSLASNLCGLFDWLDKLLDVLTRHGADARPAKERNAR